MPCPSLTYGADANVVLLLPMQHDVKVLPAVFCMAFPYDKDSNIMDDAVNNPTKLRLWGVDGFKAKEVVVSMSVITSLKVCALYPALYSGLVSSVRNANYLHFKAKASPPLWAGGRAMDSFPSLSLSFAPCLPCLTPNCVSPLPLPLPLPRQQPPVVRMLARRWL